MTSLTIILGVLTFAVPADIRPQEAPDSSALTVALPHARSVITDGEIQVSPDTVAPTLNSSLTEAARVAGFSFGPDGEAVSCRGYLGCRALGPFRGLVHVTGYRRLGPDAVVVTLEMLRFTPELESPYHQVDEVYVTRNGRAAAWRISNVRTLSES